MERGKVCEKTHAYQVSQIMCASSTNDGQRGGGGGDEDVVPHSCNAGEGDCGHEHIYIDITSMRGHGKHAVVWG